MEIRKDQAKRAANVASIISRMSADVLGIVECMSLDKLRFFVREHAWPYRATTNDASEKYNLGLLYDPSKVSVRRVTYDAKPWKARIGSDTRTRTYKFTRAPLVVRVKDRTTNTEMVLAVVHTKSKRVGNSVPADKRWITAFNNRKRIVAEGRRLREILLDLAERRGTPYDRILVVGDVNDGPDFDEYELRLSKSGVEAHIGSVLDPDNIWYSFVDLSDGKGQPTAPFGKGVHLDHMLYAQSLKDRSGKPRIVSGSGRVRSDLVNIKSDGKKRDSDHAPVQLELDM